MRHEDSDNITACADEPAAFQGGQGSDSNSEAGHSSPETQIESPRPSDPTQNRMTHFATWVGRFFLLNLVASTSYALAIYVSTWLVIPYLTLMAFVLGLPGSLRPPSWAARRSFFGGQLAKVIRLAANARSSKESVGNADGSDEASEPGDSNAAAGADSGLTDETETEDIKVKPKRGKGRGRKPKAPMIAPSTVEPVPVSWVRVGPGKFVRSDLLQTGAFAPMTSILDVPQLPERDGVQVGAMEREKSHEGEAPYAGDDPFSGSNFSDNAITTDRCESADCSSSEQVSEAQIEFREHRPDAVDDEVGPTDGQSCVPEWEQGSTREELEALGLVDGVEETDAEDEKLAVVSDVHDGLGHCPGGGLAPDDLESGEWEDNGIAPDASNEPFLDAPDNAEASRPEDLEVSPSFDRPQADIVSSPLAFTTVAQVPNDFVQLPDVAMEEKCEQDADPWSRQALPAPKAARTVRKTSRPILAYGVRSINHRRLASFVVRCRSGASRVVESHRVVQTARVSGKRRATGRLRNVGNSPHAVRAHAPRSPPRRQV